MYVDKSRTYIGIVEENKDPKKIGRCRVRVIDIFDDIEYLDKIIIDALSQAAQPSND